MTAPYACASFPCSPAVLGTTFLAAAFFAAQSIAHEELPEPTPFCADGGRLEHYLDRSGFTADDKITFASGTTFQRYRYLGDVLWVAHWPDGKSCLLTVGLTPSPSFPQ